MEIGPSIAKSLILDFKVIDYLNENYIKTFKQIYLPPNLGNLWTPVLPKANDSLVLGISHQMHTNVDSPFCRGNK